ncbi:hypothetical protein Fmac_010676 [Flemingia macrophylla]|uniref:pyridoxal 5'-phosphate synthase n=1 Tax=Flemingia macrophylla TaxID=520843 RepID=A0ABD1MME6_9FABA
MSVSYWKQFLPLASRYNKMEKNNTFAQSSTISQISGGIYGTVGNRTLLERKVQTKRRGDKAEDSKTDNIQINTDTRTRKIEELKLCPSAEICWYFTDSWEQFRINGKVDIIDALNPDPQKLQFVGGGGGSDRDGDGETVAKAMQRENSWFASSWRSRSQYLWPNPGLPCLNEKAEPEISLDPSTGPIDAFCLLVLEPNQVDYLNLKSNQRLTFKSSVTVAAKKSWTVERINP